MTPVLCAVFLLSGASALIFENLWFRQAGLAFGTTVWASSLVLSGFMGGLALGNAWVARAGPRIARPIRAYAWLEAAVALTGLALVVGLPHLPRPLASLFRPLLGEPLALNAIRFTLAFALLLVPSTAMGATLPLLVKALHRHRPGFGTALGWLYGWNTLGAMLGAIAAEEWLVPAFGIRASAGAAVACNAAAILMCLTVLRPIDHPLAEAPENAPSAPDRSRARVLGASALSGASLLALEVVWFRFLQLFVHSSTRSFAIMLMVVLLGIGSGSLIAGWWLRARPAAWRVFGPVALAAGLLVVASYQHIDLVAPAAGSHALVSFGDVARLSLWLMLPISLLSGVLFTFIGRAAFETWGEETRTTGWVTMANTLGAMVGSLAAAWWLLPALGIEGSFFCCALLYGVVAVLAPRAWLRSAGPRRARLAAYALAGLYLLSLAGFPFGAMRHRIVPAVVARWLDDGTRIASFQEGLNETIVYLERRRLGLVAEHQLVTNSYSMAGTSLPDQRYMSHFVYWPLAFHPEVRKALLISYGVGVTAGALVDSREIEQIDVVDISPEIVAMNRIVYRDPSRYPPDDPRVRVIVEDGRFFLLVSDEHYDLITAEPPPLGVAGVVNLYTREYFELLRERLAEGGIVTYWLPVGLLADSDARHVIRAFCDAFPDCSLWRGVRWEWMLAGSRRAERNGPPPRETFERQWRDARVAEQLRILGFEAPELLLTTFLGDSDFLHTLTANDPPLVDDRPARVGRSGPRGFPLFSRIVEPEAVLRRLAASDWLRTAAPSELIDKAVAAFPAYADMERLWIEGPRAVRVAPWARVDRLLSGSRFATFVQWHLGDGLEHTGSVQRLADAEDTRAQVEPFLAIRAVARGEFERAATLLRGARERGFDDPKLYYVEILAEAYSGRVDRARALAAELASRREESRTDPAFWDFVAERFGIANPYAARPSG